MKIDSKILGNTGDHKKAERFDGVRLSLFHFEVDEFSN